MSTNFPRGREAFDLPYEQLDAVQRTFVDRISAGPRGRVPINLRAWLHNIDFAAVAEPFGLYVSERAASISKREKEITILVNARFWRAAFEWTAHERAGLKVGLTPEQIKAIREGRSPAFDDAGEQLTYELAYALHEERHVNDRIYQAAMAHFGHQGVSDRIGLIGLYSMIAMTLNFYDVAVPAETP